MPTHTAIAAVAKGQFDAIQVETERPGAGQVRIKVAYASLIAFDTYITDVGYGVAKYPVGLGFNAAATVVEVGEGVTALAVGDRVIAFSVYEFGKGTGGLKGTMQEFVVLADHLCGKIPDNLALDAAATIPDNFVTAFYTLFDMFALPTPARFPAPTPPPDHALPILIYGAGSTTGKYAIQLLHAAGYTNIVATASPKHHAFLRALGATRVVDYASATFAADVTAGGAKIALALDAISAEGTLARVAGVLSPQATVALVLPIKEGDTVAVGDAGLHAAVPPSRNPFAPETKIMYVRTFTYRQNEYLKENLMPVILPQLLAAGIIQPNRVRLLEQGTFKERVAAGLDLLRNNRVSGEKVIVKVP